MEKQKSIIEKVTSVEDALAIAGKTMEEIVCPSDTKDEAAYKVLKTVIAVLNEGWKADLTDTAQYKYYPWFKYSGSGLAYTHYDYWSTNTICGVRLSYRSYDLMKHGVKILHQYYNEFLNN